LSWTYDNYQKPLTYFLLGNMELFSLMMEAVFLFKPNTLQYIISLLLLFKAPNHWSLL